MEIAGIHYESGKPVRIRVEDGIIAEISETGTASSDIKSLYVAPGLIDNQVNGYAGADFAAPSLDKTGLGNAAKSIWMDGVTTFLPTIVTGSYESLIKSFNTISGEISDPFFRGSIPGFHLEGPWLSREQGYYGCHPSEHLRDPSWKEFLEYQSAAGGRIIELTIAPELKGSMELIRKCSEAGVIIAIGHTNATAEQIDMAVENGARLSTHLGNGCANLIHRHYNPLWPQLANDLLVPSIIADGHHLLPEEIKVFYRVKGPDNIILTSDVTFLIGMAAGFYEYMGSRIQKTEDGLIKNPELNCLAGASMPLKKGVQTVMEVTGCRMAEAINMAGKNVARVLGLNDRGALEPGKRADIILFEFTGGEVFIKETYISGEKVF